MGGGRRGGGEEAGGEEGGEEGGGRRQEAGRRWGEKVSTLWPAGRRGQVSPHPSGSYCVVGAPLGGAGPLGGGEVGQLC